MKRINYECCLLPKEEFSILKDLEISFQKDLIWCQKFKY